jgi:hypothetical protein
VQGLDSQRTHVLSFFAQKRSRLRQKFGAPRFQHYRNLLTRIARLTSAAEQRFAERVHREAEAARPLGVARAIVFSYSIWMSRRILDLDGTCRDVPTTVFSFAFRARITSR